MKAFIFAFLNAIPYAFSKKPEGRLNLLKSRENRNYGRSVDHGLVNLLSKRSLSSPVWSIVLSDDTSMYSLVLESSITTEEKCKSFLRGLCWIILKLPGGDFTNILKKLCDETKRDNYCKGLFTEGHFIKKDLLKKCNGLKTELEYYLYYGEDAFLAEKNARTEVEHCENLETLCNVFERICHDTIAGLCTRFKGLCYKRLYADYEDRILLRVIDDELVYDEQGHYPKCVRNLLKECYCLISMGPSMVSSCFLPPQTCQYYAEGKRTTCRYLDKYLGEFFSGGKLHIEGYSQDVSRNNCSFLGVCYYYLAQCSNQTIKDLCNSTVIKECSEENDPDLLFMGQMDLGTCKSTFKDFNLTWYFSGEKGDGILFPHKDPYLTSLIIYGSSLRGTPPSLEQRCKDFLDSRHRTNTYVFPNLKAYCESGRTDECDNMDAEVTKMCTNLNATLKELGLNSSEGIWAVLWNSTANKITTPQCIMLTEQCFYLGRLCSGIKDICVNLRALCHTVGTKRSNLNNFWKKLKEDSPSLDLNVFNIKNDSADWSSVNKPIENACAKFGATNEILFRCDLFTRLLRDFSWRYKDLVWSFNYTDGNRTLAECAYYFSECNGLSGIFKDLAHNCTTLQKTCLNGYKPKKSALINPYSSCDHSLIHSFYVPFPISSYLHLPRVYPTSIHKEIQRSGSLDPPYASPDSIGEEGILALILGKDAINKECEQELEKYCNDFGNMGLKSKDFHPALEGLCQEIKQKCTDLKTKITNTSENAKKFLQGLSNSLGSSQTTLNKVKCNYVHLQYMVFQEFPDFHSLCNTLDEQCHAYILQTLAHEALSRALGKNLKTQLACETTITDFCLKLSGENYYLFSSCFHQKYTCETLFIEKKNNCESLEKDIKNLFENIHKLEKDCHPLLEKCYFHSSSCEETIIQNCKDLKNHCKGKNISYSPYGHPFDPLKFPPTLQEKIGLNQLFAEAETLGVLNIKLLLLEMHRFILFTYHVKNSSDKKMERCTNYLGNCTFKYLTKKLWDLCNTTNPTNICRQINNTVQPECKSFQLTLEKNGFFNINAKTKFHTLDKLFKMTYEEIYTDLISRCYYLQSVCDDLIEACKVVKAAYYRTQLSNLAKEVLEGELFGFLHDLGSGGIKGCALKLVEKCKKVRNDSIDLLSMCLKPKETCEALMEDVERKALQLQSILNEKRDYPEEKDCIVLEKKCENLSKDFEELNAPCSTLRRNCAHLRNAQKLKDALLNKNNDVLATVDNCTKYLEMKCPRWFTREMNPFSLTCVAHYKTCTRIREDVQNHCSALEQNMKIENVVKQSEESEKKDNICFFWEKYCDMLMGNCPDKLKKDNGEGELCVKLKRNCKTFRDKFPLLKHLMYSIKGYLTDKDACSKRLNYYCTDSTKLDKTFEDSCKEYSKDGKTRTEICNKFIKWMEILCDNLPVKLNKVAKDLKDRVAEFEETKKQAEKAVSDSGLFLVVSQTADRKQNHYRLTARGNLQSNATAYIKLVRRDDLDIESSVRHGLAFDLMSLVIELYLEAKDICGHFIQECVFEDDCPSFKNPCEEIRKYCKVFVLPKAMSSTETSVSTATDGKPKSTVTMKDGKCVAIDSKTTWVTSKSVSTKTKTRTSVTTSKQKCKPVPCTTEEARTKGRETGGAGTKIPSRGTKIFGLTVMNIVIWIYSFELRSGLVLHDPVRAVARAVKRRAAGGQDVYDDEDYLLALIFKKNNLEETPCKQKLKEYCENLKKVDENFSINSKLKETCKDNNSQEKKCKELKNSVQKKCTTFENKLKEAVKKPISKLEDTDCKENEQECLFLEEACQTDLKEDCNTIRTNCYQKKRDEVAEEALMRALSGNLKDKDECKEKINDVCKLLFQGSDELLKKCIDTDTTCQHLPEAAKKKCDSLKTKIEDALTKDDKLKENGHSLLKECYFYGGNCGNDGPKCDKLKDECKKAGLVYTPPGSHFDPTRPEPTVMEKIGLEELYQEAAAQGVVIERALEGDLVDLLVLLSGKKEFNKDKCKEALSKNCNSTKHLAESLEELCNNSTKHEDECEELKKTFDRKKGFLAARFTAKGFEENTMSWSKLPEVFDEYECTVLQSDCLYYGQFFEKQCKNVKAACYKRGLDALAKEALRNVLRGKFNDKTRKLSEEFSKELIKACKELKNTSKELFVLCIQPLEAIGVLQTDLYVKTSLLHDHLNMKRDFPTKEDCRELLKKCEDLRPDSEEIEWPCRTLKYHCARLSVAEQLEEKLLAEKVENLDNFDSCVENLRGQCNTWSRRWRTEFSLACVTPNVTCRYVAGSVGSKCATLDERIEASNIIDQLKKNGNKKESICNSWMPFCTKFISSCGNLTVKNGGKCKELEKECKSFIEREKLEKKVVDELKGHLKTEEKCKETLNRYCTQWEEANNGLKILCTDKNKDKGNDSKVREVLCKKLVGYVKKQCPELERKLSEAKNRLEKKEKEYENIKKETEEAMKTAGLNLFTTKNAGNKSEDKVEAAASNTAKNMAQFRLVRRNAVAKVTEDEVKAFDLVSQTLSLYVELKEECEDSLRKCGFEEECEKYKDTCKTVKRICTELKPLEIKSQEIIIKNTTTMITETETIGPDGKKTVSEQCKSIQTTDTWITRTSTHTSTSTSTSTITSTVTLTSTRRCKPTRCTTGDEAGEVTPSGALRMRGWGVMKGLLLGMMISVMI
ncbi:hypothetical protein PMAC_000265 [Pneumocystis sp. 'macacae']|nr:hypothetical protein PMAC_000265 [Pneumocystis sp. 'macacae']